jgi:AraC-like DNA-binding protein
MMIPNIQFEHNEDKPPLYIDILELGEFYQRFGTLHSPPYEPHRIKFHGLLYIIEAQGSHFIDFVSHQYQASRCIFVNKDQVQSFNFTSKPKGYLILFTDDFLNNLRSNIRTSLFTQTGVLTSNSATLNLSPTLMDSCSALISEITSELSRQESDILLVQMLFTSLLLKLNRERLPQQSQLSERHQTQFNQFIQLLAQEYTNNRDAKSYAALMHITYKTLNQLCKQVCNKTAKQLIDAHVILEAKRQLAVEQVQVQQLAFSLGFNEVTNFIKYFKRHTSQTPTQFKSAINKPPH